MGLCGFQDNRDSHKKPDIPICVAGSVFVEPLSKRTCENKKSEPDNIAGYHGKTETISAGNNLPQTQLISYHEFFLGLLACVAHAGNNLFL